MNKEKSFREFSFMVFVLFSQKFSLCDAFKTLTEKYDYRISISPGKTFSLSL